MGVREGLLALLNEGPKHGYQLKQEFEAATGDAWVLNIGQVYTTLQRLERDGLAETCSPEVERRQDYQLTAEGRGAVTRWLDEPVPMAVTKRDEVSMKVLMAVATGVRAAVDVAAGQREATMTALQDYTRLKAEAAVEDLAWRLHLDRLILQADAEVRWLDLVEDRLVQAGHRASPVRRNARADEAKPVLAKGTQ